MVEIFQRCGLAPHLPNDPPNFFQFKYAIKGHAVLNNIPILGKGGIAVEVGPED
jgi:hypothetical protein